MHHQRSPFRDRLGVVQGWETAVRGRVHADLDPLPIQSRMVPVRRTMQGADSRAAWCGRADYRIIIAAHR